MLIIRDEIPADGLAREVLLDTCFGTARFEKTSERLREDRLPARGLALSAVLGGEPVGAGAEAGAGEDLIGTVRLWNISAGSAGQGLLLGPLAVDSAHRSLGVGARLMREALWRAARAGHRFVLLVGDAPYYARFGFELAPTGLELPGPVERARFLAFEIRPGALRGATGLVRPTGRKLSQRNIAPALPLAA